MLSLSKSFLTHHNYVAIEAMTFVEDNKPDQWLTNLVAAAAHCPEGLKKSVFELQILNWNTLDKIPPPIFIERLELSRKLGAHHIGYYSDDVYLDQPRLTDLQKQFSNPLALVPDCECMNSSLISKGLLSLPYQTYNLHNLELELNQC